MIENSSDGDAQTLWNQIGGSSAVGAYDASAGLTATDLNTQGYWGESTTSAADQIRLLDELVWPGLLSQASRSYELELMENIEPDQDWGVSAGVPSGVSVALKNGWVPLSSDSDWEINSIGRIRGDGRDYLIAVLTAHDPSQAYGIATIQGISPLVWSGLAPPAARKT
jgi:beta-lactamase class A